MKINLQNSSLRISAGLPKQFPTDPMPQVAFSGRSNVGKSSLVNSLLTRKNLARVSSAPGKTITVNFYDIDKKLFLVDLPGYGFAKRPPEDKKKWAALTDGYFTNNKNIDLLKLVVQLIDCRVGITDDDRMMIRFMNEMELPYAIVMTKIDKLNKTELLASIEKISNDGDLREGTPVVQYSSLKNIGKSELWNVIYEYCES